MCQPRRMLSVRAPTWCEQTYTDRTPTADFMAQNLDMQMAVPCARRMPGALAGAMIIVFAAAAQNFASAQERRPPLSPAPPAGAWRLVRTPSPSGAATAVSIMHTPDPARSDLDLAGLMIRCADPDLEMLVVVVRPFRPRTQPQIRIGPPGKEISVAATVVPPGAVLLLPQAATVLVRGHWEQAPELTIEITDEETTTRGVVALAGLHQALQTLLASCPAK